MPYFIGGEANLLKFIQTNLHFPKKMAKKKIEGLVLVQFKIDIDGSVQNPQIMKSTHPLFAIEAMKVIKKIPNFTPGKQHNLPVQVYYKVPIYFMYE
jgi:TonB family protein